MKKVFLVLFLFLALASIVSVQAGRRNREDTGENKSKVEQSYNCKRRCDGGFAAPADMTRIETINGVATVVHPFEYSWQEDIKSLSKKCNFSACSEATKFWTPDGREVTRGSATADKYNTTWVL